uniref:Bores hole in peptidoglycan layer allowing type IV secretion complex assembly to occur (VirB1) n=1 Tax=Sphingomonas sp. NS2 TaxID=908605 RepID=A0A0D4ZZ56_9SPHN|nr:Bores hole in peptidoglycan layer allowing type IV secretion complex assembly to occur (VirB1) [Sphingomonas sp. NS2]
MHIETGAARAMEILDVASLLALAGSCAPSVAPETLISIVHTESRFNTLAIGVNSPGARKPVPATRAQPRGRCRDLGKRFRPARSPGAAHVDLSRCLARQYRPDRAGLQPLPAAAGGSQHARFARRCQQCPSPDPAR